MDSKQSEIFKVTDNTNGKLDEIRSFALKTKKTENLNDNMQRLKNMSDYYHADLNLYADFAPLSLAFTLTDSLPPFKMKLNGGLIYHGRHDGFGSGSAPTFSVCVDKADGWRIHT